MAIVIPSLILYNIVMPIFALRKLNSYASRIYLSSLKSADMTIKDKNDIDDSRSWFGFFFLGLNLGDKLYEKERKAKVDYTSVKSKDEQVDTGPSLGEKCGKFFTKLADPFTGAGVEIEVRVTKRVIVPTYTRTFYYWEFVMFAYKLIL